MKPDNPTKKLTFSPALHRTLDILNADEEKRQAERRRRYSEPQNCKVGKKYRLLASDKEMQYVSNWFENYDKKVTAAQASEAYNELLKAAKLNRMGIISVDVLRIKAGIGLCSGKCRVVGAHGSHEWCHCGKVM